MAAINQVQRVGAKTITGCSQTLATAVGEAEASIRTIRVRHLERAVNLRINLQTLPKINPLARVNHRAYPRFVSPLQKMGAKLASIPLDRLKTIEAYTIAPWQSRASVITDEAGWQEVGDNLSSVFEVAISSSVKEWMVGAGGAVCDRLTLGINLTSATYAVAVGPKAEQNLYTADLIAISRILRYFTLNSTNKRIILYTPNLAVLLVIKRPNQQSGQKSLNKEI
jgi:hypothetical protein